MQNEITIDDLYFNSIDLIDLTIKSTNFVVYFGSKIFVELQALLLLLLI